MGAIVGLELVSSETGTVPELGTLGAVLAEVTFSTGGSPTIASVGGIEGMGDVDG